MEYDIHYASGANSETTSLPPQLIAGDTPAVATSDHRVVRAGTPIGQFVPLTRDATNGFVPWSVGETVDAVSAYAIPVGTTRVALYDAAMFNIDALNWPANTTEAQAQAGLTGMIRARKLLYSKQRTGNESAYVGPGNEAGAIVLTLNPAGGSALTAGTQGAAYNQSVTAAGGIGAKTYAVSAGALPAGLSLNASTGAITGTPSAAGTYGFSVTATDTQQHSRTGAYTLVIAAP